MIVFDLSCAGGHRFEGWFGSSRDFAEQQDSGILACPTCGSLAIAKAPMAPAVGRKGGAEPRTARQGSATRAVPGSDPAKQVTGGTMPPELAKAFAQLAELQRRAVRNSRWVGGDFAETSRAMHYGEREEEAIYGKASADEANGLIEEGIRIAPLLFPVAPPDEVN